MNLNAAVEKAVNEGIEAKKDALIKQTLEEDHDYIMFKLHKIFGETYGHLDNYLKKTCLYQDESKKILNIITDMMDDVEETVTGKKKCNCDGTCEECKCNKAEEEEEDPDLIMLEEIPVDKSKRITISYNTLHEAKLTEHNELYVLKSKEDDNVFYIVDEDFNYDTNRLEYIKSVFHYGFDALRFGIGSLLDVKYGDIVGVDVYDGQLVIYNTGSNVEDLNEEKVEEVTPEDIEVEAVEEEDKPSVIDLINQINEKIKQDKLKKEPWFIQHYRIEI